MCARQMYGCMYRLFLVLQPLDFNYNGFNKKCHYCHRLKFSIKLHNKRTIYKYILSWCNGNITFCLNSYMKSIVNESVIPANEAPVDLVGNKILFS